MENKTTFRHEFANARSLCRMGAEWGIDGFVRMEIGFEIVYCEFETGLDLMSAYQTQNMGAPEDFRARSTFEAVRETSQRYQGIDSRRLILGFSNMISAYFYPVNFTNPVPSNDDPRLLFADPVQLARIKSDLATQIASPAAVENTDWQGQVVDMITSRYSDRLKFLAHCPDNEQFLGILNNLLNTYVDYSTTKSRINDIETCSKHYLLPVTLRTVHDEYLYAAVATVMTRICTTLFNARDILLDEVDTSLEVKPPLKAQQLIQELNAWLIWPDWKFCGRCADDEVCYIAMFPFGLVEDHFFPSCKNETGMSNSHGRWGPRSYWWSELKEEDKYFKPTLDEVKDL